MYCANCGSQLDESARFCAACGEPVQKEERNIVNIVPSGKEEENIVPSNTGKKNNQYIVFGGVAALVLSLSIVVSVLVILRQDGRDNVDANQRSANTASTDTGSRNEEDKENVDEPVEEKSSLTELYSSARPGNIITFGNYEQDNNLNNGMEPIEWIVLHNNGDSLFVLSKYILEKMDLNVVRGVDSINESYDYKKDGVTWEVSNIRAWLNNDFLSTAFSEEEREYILLSTISTSDTEDDWPGRNNQHFISYGGNDTEDYIFLLSFQEARDYLGPLESSAMIGMLTEAARGDHYEICDWFLRSPGLPIYWEDDYSVTSIGASAEFRTCYNYDWFEENYSGSIMSALYSDYSNYIYSGIRHSRSAGVRPAMWISIK